MTEPDGSQKTV